MEVFIRVIALMFFAFHSIASAQYPSDSSTSPNNLSQNQIAQGLIEALDQGVHRAITELGHEDGFLTNLQVRIPMPQQLTSVEKALHSIGEDKLVNEFIASMNHAAEQAVPKAASAFVDVVHHITIQDATAILTGPDDAATQYFRRVTETNLHDKFLPIVKAATEKTGVTATYKRLLGTASQNKYLGKLESFLGNNDAVDIDDYITNHAVDGLFKMIAQEEAGIRKDPVKRTSDLLKEVFGAVTRHAR